MKGMRRPPMRVVPARAVLPAERWVQPPPNRFTHQVVAAQPFTFGDTAGAPAAGRLAAGAKVVLLVRHRGDACRVVDALGRYIRTAFSGLRPLTPAR